MAPAAFTSTLLLCLAALLLVYCALAGLKRLGWLAPGRLLLPGDGKPTEPGAPKPGAPPTPHCDSAHVSDGGEDGGEGASLLASLEAGGTPFAPFEMRSARA